MVNIIQDFFHMNGGLSGGLGVVGVNQPKIV